MDNNRIQMKRFWDISLDILGLVDFHNYFLDVNPAFERILGYTKDEVLGKAFTDFIHPEDLAATLAKANLYSAGHITGEFENRYRCKNGSYRWLSWNAVSLNEEGLVYIVARDVTERKKAEEELKTYNGRQKLVEQAALLANVSDAIIGYDADFRVIYWNQAAERIYGYSAAESLGKFGYVLLEPSYAGITREELVNRIARDGHLEIESGRFAKNGRKLLVETHVISLRDSLGNLTGYVAVDRDVTERKQAEEALRETRDYLDNLFNYANAPIIVWNPKFEITRFNHAFERLTGRTVDEVLGRNLDILFPADSREASMDLIRKTSAGERWDVVEIPILHRNGTVHIVLWNSATLYAPDGRAAVATIAQGQDITERKKAEEALRETKDYLENLINYANAPIIVWNSEFRITRFNHAFEHLSGRTVDEVLGKGLDILFPDDSRRASMDYIRKTMIGERWEAVEIPILRKDGTIRIVLWNSATLFATDGKTMVATIAQGQDITERKQVEDELKQRTTELEASNKELEAFSYSVSHDLRAPLRSMEGFSSALLEDYSDKLDEEGKQYLRHIQDSSNLMARLIDDLLKLSRVTRSDMNRETVNLSEVAQKTIAELEKAEPGRRVRVSIAPNITACGDRNLLRLVLDNLLDNAWKFSSKVASPRIEVGTVEHNGRQAYFVRDNGVGFDMTYAAQLFKPFQRLHKVSEFTGTGIGLATVHRIIHRHGGEVWAESRVGEGATFYFTLS